MATDPRLLAGVPGQVPVPPPARPAPPIGASVAGPQAPQVPQEASPEALAASIGATDEGGNMDMGAMVAFLFGAAAGGPMAGLAFLGATREAQLEREQLEQKTKESESRIASEQTRLDLAQQSAARSDVEAASVQKFREGQTARGEKELELSGRRLDVLEEDKTQAGLHRTRMFALTSARTVAEIKRGEDAALLNQKQYI